jgi:RNA polymerase sigma-B factor
MPSETTASVIDQRLLMRYREHGDERARAELVERLLPLAHQIARRYQRRGEPLEDLVQAASVGLVKAVERFDPQRGTTLAAFAVPTMLGEIKRHFREMAWSLHVPRALQERTLQVKNASAALEPALGRQPTPAELALHTGHTEEEVLDAIEARSAHAVVSLNEPHGDDPPDGAVQAHFLATEDTGYELAEARATVAPAMRRLPARDRLVLRLRFGSELTQSQIAALLGVSQMQVSRQLRRTLADLALCA